MVRYAFFILLHRLWKERRSNIVSSRRPLATPDKLEAPVFGLASEWNIAKDGYATSVDIVPGMVSVGTDKGSVHIFTYGGGRQQLRPYLTIPPPPTSGMSVVTCKLSIAKEKASVFVGYRRSSSPSPTRGSTASVCCYDMPLPGPNLSPISAPSARHDLDGRHVPSSNLCDAVTTRDGVLFTVVSFTNIGVSKSPLHTLISLESTPGPTRWTIHLFDNPKS